MKSGARNSSEPSEQLLFAVIAIESAANKYAVSPSDLAQRLEKQGLIEGRLWKYYDQLHTQSRDYVADDLMEALRHREQRAERTRA